MKKDLEARIAVLESKLLQLRTQKSTETPSKFFQPSKSIQQRSGSLVIQRIAHFNNLFK